MERFALNQNCKSDVQSCMQKRDEIIKPKILPKKRAQSNAPIIARLSLINILTLGTTVLRDKPAGTEPWIRRREGKSETRTYAYMLHFKWSLVRPQSSSPFSGFSLPMTWATYLIYTIQSALKQLLDNGWEISTSVHKSQLYSCDTGSKLNYTVQLLIVVQQVLQMILGVKKVAISNIIQQSSPWSIFRFCHKLFEAYNFCLVWRISIYRLKI